MPSNNLYLAQESLESVNRWIEHSLELGSSVASIVKGMVGTQRAMLIITKEYGIHIEEIKSDSEAAELLSEYINDTFQDCMKRSCVSPDIRRLMEDNYYGVNLDEYSDYLTELMNTNGYQRVNHHITNIMACFKPHMLEKYPHEFKSMSVKELEVALINFIKEHLQARNDKQSKDK